MGTPDLTIKTISKVVCTVILSEIISAKEFHLSVKLKVSKVAILKNAIGSKEQARKGFWPPNAV